MDISIINVKDFGAKGDGKTDDTKAIQAALDTASESVMVRQDTYDIPYPDGIPSRCGYHCHETGPAVFFPHGHYVITDTLFPRRTLTLRGECHPWIEQKDDGKDIIYSDDSIRQTFANLAFHGGQSHLNLKNVNEDNGLVRIEDCKFYGSKSIAVHLREGAQSTMLLVLRCQIVGCEQAIVTHTDFTHIREGWLTGGTSGDGALIVCAGTGSEMTVSNLCCVPMVNGRDQRWIDNYGSLVCRSVRFGGEEGGFTPIVNFAKHVPQASGSRDPAVVVDGCVDICAWGNAKRRCVVYCEEIPNLLVVRNCGMKGIPPAMVAPRIDNEEYLVAKPGMLNFNFAGNIGELSDRVPAILAAPSVNTPPGPKSLSMEETEKALKRALEEWEKRKKREGDVKADKKQEFNGHVSKNSPEDYLPVTTKSNKWSLDAFMDGTTMRNSEYYAVAPVDEGVLLMRKAAGGCPHLLVENIEVDLDEFPYLTWDMTPNDAPANLAIKLIDKKSGREISVDTPKGEESGYRARDLRELLEEGGIRKFDLKLYYQGVRWNKGQRTGGVFAQAGDYIVIRFIRFERSQD
jgi:hypothetical protein